MNDCDLLQQIANDLQWQIIKCREARENCDNMNDREVWQRALDALNNELSDINTQIYLIMFGEA